MESSKSIHADVSSLEMHTMGTGDNQDKQTKSPNARDNVELTRTGKKPVLKVCSQYQSLASSLFHWLIFLEAQLQLHVHLEFQLHSPLYLGGSIHVCIMPT